MRLYAFLVIIVLALSFLIKKILITHTTQFPVYTFSKSLYNTKVSIYAAKCMANIASRKTRKNQLFTVDIKLSWASANTFFFTAKLSSHAGTFCGIFGNNYIGQFFLRLILLFFALKAMNSFSYTCSHWVIKVQGNMLVKKCPSSWMLSLVLLIGRAV